MKVLKIIHGYPPLYNAGSEVYTQSVCTQLSKNHDVTVFTREEVDFYQDFQIRTERKDGLSFVFVNMARAKDGYNHPIINERFQHLIQKLKPDVAHIGHLNHLSTGIVDILSEMKVPIVFTLHDFWLMCPRGQFLQRNFDGEHLFELCDGQVDSKCASSCYKMYHSGVSPKTDQEYWESWIHSRMETTRLISEKVDLFIAPSQYLRNRFINEFCIPSDKIKYLDYGFPTEYLSPTLVRKESTQFTFGYIGTHIPAKGINLLIEAFSKTFGDSRLFIWGRNGSQSSTNLRQLARNLTDRIVFMGEYVNHNLADHVFSQVDCIIVPSIWTENSPLVIHEAQACHIPVITADVGGMAEYVHHLGNGLLFKHRDTSDLKDKIQFAVDHPEVMKNMGKRGYLYSDEGTVPSIEYHCQQLEEIYSMLIQNKNEN